MCDFCTIWHWLVSEFDNLLHRKWLFKISGECEHVTNTLSPKRQRLLRNISLEVLQQVMENIINRAGLICVSNIEVRV